MSLPFTMLLLSVDWLMVGYFLGYEGGDLHCLMTAWNENEQAIKNWLLKKTGDPDQTQDEHELRN